MASWFVLDTFAITRILNRGAPTVVLHRLLLLTILLAAIPIVGAIPLSVRRRRTVSVSLVSTFGIVVSLLMDVPCSWASDLKVCTSVPCWPGLILGTLLMISADS